MQHVEPYIRQVQKEQGWTDATLLQVLIDYIAYSAGHTGIVPYLQERSEDQ